MFIFLIRFLDHIGEVSVVLGSMRGAGRRFRRRSGGEACRRAIVEKYVKTSRAEGGLRRGNGYFCSRLQVPRPSASVPRGLKGNPVRIRSYPRSCKFHVSLSPTGARLRSSGGGTVRKVCILCHWSFGAGKAQNPERARRPARCRVNVAFGRKAVGQGTCVSPSYSISRSYHF